MSQTDLKDEIKDQFTDVLTRLESKNLFQSDWDVAAFAMFFIFIGTILFLALLVIIRCFCCCGCDDEPRRHKVGIDNMALDP